MTFVRLRNCNWPYTNYVVKQGVEGVCQMSTALAYVFINLVNGGGSKSSRSRLRCLRMAPNKLSKVKKLCTCVHMHFLHSEQYTV